MPAGTSSPSVGCATTSKPGVWARTALARARTAAMEKRIMMVGAMSWVKERLGVRELLRMQARLDGKRADICRKEWLRLESTDRDGRQTRATN